MTTEEYFYFFLEKIIEKNAMSISGVTCYNHFLQAA